MQYMLLVTIFTTVRLSAVHTDTVQLQTDQGP